MRGEVWCYWGLGCLRGVNLSASIPCAVQGWGWLFQYRCLNCWVLLRSIINKCNTQSHRAQSQYFQKSSTLLYFFIEGKPTSPYTSTTTPNYAFTYTPSSELPTGAYSAAGGRSTFLQPQHLQASEQPTPALQHSQYRLRQPVFLQVQRLSERLELRVPRSLAANLAWETSLLYQEVFLHPLQAQSSPQTLSEEKHSQYILRQKVFLQVQPVRFFLAELGAVGTWEMRQPSESSPASAAASPVAVPTTASSIFSKEEC